MEHFVEKVCSKWLEKGEFLIFQAYCSWTIPLRLFVRLHWIQFTRSNLSAWSTCKRERNGYNFNCRFNCFNKNSVLPNLIITLIRQLLQLYLLSFTTCMMIYIAAKLPLYPYEMNDTCNKLLILSSTINYWFIWIQHDHKNLIFLFSFFIWINLQQLTLVKCSEQMEVS